MRKTDSAIASYTELQGVRVPRFLYGTAWKEDDTALCSSLALAAGFRGIDTANQARHYHEAGVGEAIEAALAEGVLGRAELFVQTKFTYESGQDHRLPYDKNAPLATQVEQSFESSLKHLGVEYVDSYLLHGPSRRHGLATADWETWQAMEKLQRAGRARLIGVSNVSLDQLEELHARAAVKPAMVQNRCYAAHGWDAAVRAFCTQHGLLYQGFSLLTANPAVLSHPRVSALSAELRRTPAQIVFRFAQQVGMVTLTGTRSPEHMAEDLAVDDFALPLDAMQLIEKLAA